MRFEDEQYVRLYKRDTTAWLMLPWESRCMLPLVLKACDRAGIIDLGEDGYEGLAATCRVPLSLVEAAMPEILRRKILIQRGDGILLWPKYIEAQEAKQSDKARQKTARDRARDLALAAERGVDVPHTPAAPSSETVTPCDATVTPRDEPSRDAPVSDGSVTNRNEVNRNEVKGVQGAAPCAEGSAPPSLPILVVQDATTKAKDRKRVGRMPMTYMREDWKPKPEHEEYVRASGLDVEAVAEDFRNHWRGEGKMRADWNATFKQNVDRIKRTDWLVVKFTAPKVEPELPILRLAHRDELLAEDFARAETMTGFSFGATK